MRRAIAIAALLASACSSASGTMSGTPPRKVVAGWRENGHSISLQVGDVLQVRLVSTYWRFGPAPNNGVLSPGPRVVHAGRESYPGSGAGTVEVTYRALHDGTAAISARRTSCGEAMRCTGGQGVYRLSVVVG